MYENAQLLRGDLAGIPSVMADGGLGVSRKARGPIPQFFIELRPAPDGHPGAVIEIEMVKFLIPGDVKSAPCRKVTDRIRIDYRDQYEAWKRGQQLAADGTPLAVWPVMAATPALLDVLKIHHVYTVEALAELPDTAMQAIGIGTRDLVTKAKHYVEARRADAPVARVEAQNRALEAQLAEMRLQMEKMMEAQKAAALAASEPALAASEPATDGEDPPRRGPGRPRKEI